MFGQAKALSKIRQIFGFSAGRAHKRIAVSHVDLFPLLHNRMSRENQHVPHYVGEFDGPDALPKGRYPAVYYWVDRSISNGIRLSFNTPLLQQWCVEEAHQLGLVVNVDSAAVKGAIEVLQEVAASTFQSLVEGKYRR